MRVIAKSHLRRFWEARREDSNLAERELSTWYKLAEHADWAALAPRPPSPTRNNW